jgi:hypothetical protein
VDYIARTIPSSPSGRDGSATAAERDKDAFSGAAHVADVAGVVAALVRGRATATARLCATVVAQATAALRAGRADASTGAEAVYLARTCLVADGLWAPRARAVLALLAAAIKAPPAAPATTRVLLPCLLALRRLCDGAVRADVADEALHATELQAWLDTNAPDQHEDDADEDAGAEDDNVPAAGDRQGRTDQGAGMDVAALLEGADWLATLLLGPHPHAVRREVARLLRCVHQTAQGMPVVPVVPVCLLRLGGHPHRLLGTSDAGRAGLLMRLTPLLRDAGRAGRRASTLLGLIRAMAASGTPPPGLAPLCCTGGGWGASRDSCGCIRRTGFLSAVVDAIAAEAQRLRQFDRGTLPASDAGGLDEVCACVI